MNDPVTPPTLLPTEEVRQPNAAEARASHSISDTRTWGEQIFEGPHGLRVGWSVLLYLGVGGAAAYALLWFGKSFFPDPVHGASKLWQEMYGELALLVAAVLPAFLIANIEKRSIDDYGLPRKQAFGAMFWIGSAWGLVAILVLLTSMRGVHVFYFGHWALHGLRVWEFAAFWGVYFILVGLFEEFLLRGYMLFAFTHSLGFWPAAVLLSFTFGAIHLFNSGEGLAGALSAAVIGFFFCLTLRRTGTLWFAVGFHAAWDWGQTYLCGVPNSGTTEPGHLLSPSVQGPVWLTGGSVGPEGSVLCFVLVVLLWAIFARRYPQAKYSV